MEQAWLTFASTLIWQLLILLVIVLFREEVASLIQRIQSLKPPGVGEYLFFQPPAPDPPPRAKEAREELELVGPDGFFTKEGIARLIEKSGLIDAGERVLRCFLLFQTLRQRTWLVVTNKYVYCVLDDEDTRAAARLIQWRMPLADAKPIRVREYRGQTGLIDIGTRQGWLYSLWLHPNGKELVREIQSMVQSAQKARGPKRGRECFHFWFGGVANNC
jgi:hypothetical protein